MSFGCLGGVKIPSAVDPQPFDPGPVTPSQEVLIFPTPARFLPEVPLLFLFLPFLFTNFLPDIRHEGSCCWIRR